MYENGQAAQTSNNEQRFDLSTGPRSAQSRRVQPPHVRRLTRSPEVTPAHCNIDTSKASTSEQSGFYARDTRHCKSQLQHLRRVSNDGASADAFPAHPMLPHSMFELFVPSIHDQPQGGDVLVRVAPIYKLRYDPMDWNAENASPPVVCASASCT